MQPGSLAESGSSSCPDTGGREAGGARTRPAGVDDADFQLHPPRRSAAARSVVPEQLAGPRPARAVAPPAGPQARPLWEMYLIEGPRRRCDGTAHEDPPLYGRPVFARAHAGPARRRAVVRRHRRGHLDAPLVPSAIQLAFDAITEGLPDRGDGGEPGGATARSHRCALSAGHGHPGDRTDLVRQLGTAQPAQPVDLVDADLRRRIDLRYGSRPRGRASRVRTRRRRTPRSSPACCGVDEDLPSFTDTQDRRVRDARRSIHRTGSVLTAPVRAGTDEAWASQIRRWSIHRTGGGEDGPRVVAAAVAGPGRVPNCRRFFPGGTSAPRNAPHWPPDSPVSPMPLPRCPLV